MKFTIIAYPSQFSETGINHLLIRVKDGATVGMIEECAVNEMRKILGMDGTDEVLAEMDCRQMRFPFDNFERK